MPNDTRKKPTQKRSEQTLVDILEASTVLLNELGEEKFHQFSTTKVSKKWKKWGRG